MSLVASLDVGSNTLRLLIAEVGPDSGLKPVLLERRVTRLSQNLVPGGRLFGPARERTLRVLDQFSR
ncbi:MAG: Ppx/GppA family phosphatase, partial [Deltaproteobacteria bacterium]|nr:Ppx/GppA family phosphatase [Deltaproteobacteria bacterium]